MKKQRWGEKYVDKRNWKEYNEKQVARGEAYISLDFIELWDKELGLLCRQMEMGGVINIAMGRGGLTKRTPWARA